MCRKSSPYVMKALRLPVLNLVFSFGFSCQNEQLEWLVSDEVVK